MRTRTILGGPRRPSPRAPSRHTRGVSNPAIILVSGDHLDVLEQQFSRYAREYDVRLAATRGRRQAPGPRRPRRAAARSPCSSSSPSCPTWSVYPAIAKIRQAVPTARRVVVAHWENFRRDAEALRAGQATGKYDAFLLMPRGVRDEEFHTAIIDLLNDWAATVAVPEVVTVRIVTPEHDALTLPAARLPRPVGLPCGVFHPDSEDGPRRALAPRRRAGRWPVVEAFTSTAPFVPTTTRDLAVTLYGRPDDIEVDQVVDLVVIGAGPAGLAASVYGRQRGPVHGHRRGRGDRRPGRHQLDDPQLPRLPARHLRACGWPSAPATRRSGSAPASSPAGRSPPSSPATDGRPARRPHRGRRRARPRRS